MKTVILMFLLGLSLTYSSTTEKSSSTEDTTSAGPAILAIEIIDNNTTSSEIRNSTKRTIESALGYGYQSNYYPTSQGKKFMIYPYSQHDIPPASVKETKYVKDSSNIQKSLSYNLGTKVEAGPTKGYSSQEYSPPSAGGYYPSTLYSSVGQGGVLGGLSTNLQQHVPAAATTIPVIILRVYTNQLTDPKAIYPNLPQNSPYSALNNIDLQSIISNYLQQQMSQIQSSLMYKQPAYQSYSQSPSPNYAYYNQNTQNAADNLPTHENYPSDSHTRVIYHGPKGHINIMSQYEASQNTQTYLPSTQTVQSTQNYPTKSQTVYTDSKGQNYIYVDPKELQSSQFFLQDYQQPSYQQEYQPDYQQSYQTNDQHNYQSNNQQIYQTSPQQLDQAAYQPNDQQTYQPTYQKTYPSNNQQTYHQNDQSSYQQTFQQNDQPSYQSSYQPSYQQNYKTSYETSYQPTYQTITQQSQQKDAKQNYQQLYQQDAYQQVDYQQFQPQYQQEVTKQSYQKPQEDRKYLPTAATTEKVHNYHAESGRSKKNSGANGSLEAKKTETKRKS